MRALDRARKDSEAIFRRIGHRSLYQRIIEDGYFEVSDRTKIEVALNADYFEALRMISEQNAKIT